MLSQFILAHLLPMNVCMINQPMLTISVPTYNRAEYLDLCLERICEEIDGLSADQHHLVRVCVADNGSTDDTPNIVSRYQGRLDEKFEAVRTSDNKGMDFNFTRCYELAKTPYVWLIGDDDVILPGGLKKVLDVLIKNEIDLLYVNNYWFKDSYSQKPNRGERHGISIFVDPLEFTRRTNVMLTYLSGLIVRSGVGLSYRSELAGSNLVQLSWVLPLLRDGKCFAIIEDWVVAAKEANTGGYGLIKVFGTNLQRITNMILKDKPELAKAIENGTIVNFFPGFVLELRGGSSNFKDKDMAVGLKQVFCDNWRYYAFLVPLIVMPLCLSKYYYYLVRLVRLLIGPILI